jgi:hypothetical protein
MMETKGRKVNDALRRDRNFLHDREPAAAACRWVLNGGDQQHLAERRRQREHVGFGATGREYHVAGMRPDEGCDPFARLLNEAAGRPASGMDRRRIAGYLQRGQHGGACLRTELSGRVPVEIGRRHFAPTCVCAADQIRCQALQRAHFT